MLIVERDIKFSDDAKAIIHVETTIGDTCKWTMYSRPHTTRYCSLDTSPNRKRVRAFREFNRSRFGLARVYYVSSR
jgi:hypothetical protein